MNIISIEKQVRDSFRSILRIGVSKHKERIKHYAKTGNYKSPYIHSIGTFTQYSKICIRAIAWITEHFPDAKNLSYIKRKRYAHYYIQHLIDIGRRASYIATVRSALSKLFRCNGPEIHDNIPIRKESDIHYSHNYNLSDYEKDLLNPKYHDALTISRATGARKHELAKMMPEQFGYNAIGKMYCRIKGKGGKVRDAYIYPDNYDKVKRILKKYECGEIMFNNIPDHTQAIRRMYAGDWYNHLAKDADPKEKITIYKHKKPVKISAVIRKRDGRMFDREALLTVSNFLGHNRTDVMSRHYIQFCNPINKV